MSNVLSDDKKQQVLALGRSLRRIEQATAVRRETASAYLKAAGIAVRGRGGQPGVWPPKPATTAGVSTDPERLPWPPAPGRAPSASACEPFREVIVEALARGRNAMAIWQDLVDDHGFRSGYASVKRFVLKLRGSTPVEARVVITTAPGEESQVDYGDGPMVRHAATGKYRRTRLFVMTLGYSRKSVRLLAWKSGAQEWAELHEQAFRRLGGTYPAWAQNHDNLKEGVLTPDIYDPTLNPLYRDVLAHYGVVALPCRVRNPDRSATRGPVCGRVARGLWVACAGPLRFRDRQTDEPADSEPRTACPSRPWRVFREGESNQPVGKDDTQDYLADVWVVGVELHGLRRRFPATQVQHRIKLASRLYV